MINLKNNQRRLKVSEIIYYLFISILVNSIGNALTIISGLGSAVWTSSAVNVNEWLHFGLGTILFAYAIIVQALNVILRQRIDWRMIISNLFFAFSFSYLIQVWVELFKKIGLNHISIWWLLVIDIFGLLLIAIAISIYQRVNVMLHPNDEFSYLLRFKLLHGSATLGQYCSYIIPLIILAICFVKLHRIYVFGIGTIFALIFQGPIIGWSDKHIFKKLVHKI